MDENELRRLAEAGEIDDDTPVMSDGMTAWERLGDVRLPRVPEPEPFGEPQAPEPLWYCSQCGGRFTSAQCLGFGNMVVCATCKPLFVHRFKEGASLVNGIVLAGFGARAAARFIDFVIGYLLCSMILAITMLTVQAVDSLAALSQLIGFLFWAIMIGFFVVYELVFLGRWGATPGKMILRIRVVGGDQNKLSWGRALGRAFAHMISFMACYVGYFVSLFDQEQRTLHDLIANTRVVRRS